MMIEDHPWYELLDQLIGREGFSRAQVARRSGVRVKTIASWIRGDVVSPRHWQPLAHVLQAIQADTRAVNTILQKAGHLPVHRLAEQCTEQELNLLANWLTPDIPFMSPDRLVLELVGRVTEQKKLLTLLQEHHRCVLVGMGGVGKTTLAIELAHQLQPIFPDGVFWADMRTAEAETIVESWGQLCGLQLQTLADFSSRAARLRDVLAKKQALLIFDDVVDGALVQQMLPKQGAGAILITTRSEDVANLLTNRQSAQIIQLQPMDKAQSANLMGQIMGEHLLDRASSDTQKVVDLLGGLPLALHICAALCTNEGIPLADMVSLLEQLHTRLTYLQLDDKQLVRLAFEQSWLMLDEAMQQGLALLAVFAGRPFDLAAFSAISQLPKPKANWVLTRLCRRSLLTVRKQGERYGETHQYQQHTLLAAYVNEKLDLADPAWSRFSHYFAQKTKEGDWWLEAPVNLWGHVMAGIGVAYQQADWSLVLTYLSHLKEAWQRKGFYALARQGYKWGLTAVQATQNQPLEAEIQLAWGRVCLEQADDQPAQHHLEQALALFEKQDNKVGVADVQYHWARIKMTQGAYAEAEQAIQMAYRAYQTEEDVQGMARSLYRLSDILYYSGAYERAYQLVQDAIHTQTQIADALGLLRSYLLGTMSLIQLGHIDMASQQCGLASKLVEQVDDQAEKASFYYTYADVLRNQQQFDKAQETAERALHLFEEMGDCRSEINTLILLAGNKVLWYEMEPDLAHLTAGMAYCKTGLQRGQLLEYPLGQGFLLLANGRLYAQQKEGAKACACFQQALAYAIELDHQWLQNRLQTLMNEIHCVPAHDPLPKPPLGGSPAP